MKMRAWRMQGGRRGTVILLVIASLTLLAIIGTAYIVSSRMQKGEVRDTTDAYNLKLAQDAELRWIQQLIVESTLRRTDGQLLVQGVPPWRPKPPGGATPYCTQGSTVVTGRDGNIYYCLQNNDSGFQAGRIGSPRPGVYVPPFGGEGYWWSLSWTPGVTYALNDMVIGSDGLPYKCKTLNISDMFTNITPPLELTNWAFISGNNTAMTMTETRSFDYPELGDYQGSARHNVRVPDQSWLTADYPWWNSSTTYSLGNMVLYQGYAYICVSGVSSATPPPADVLPTPGAHWSLLPYNPATLLSPARASDFPAWNVATPYVAGNAVAYQGMVFSCITGNAGQAPSGGAAWRAVSSLRFDPSTGVNDLLLPPTGPEVGAIAPVANSATPVEADSYFNLLPFSSASGARYRVAMRVVDTCGRLNLNTGQVWDTGIGGNPTADGPGEYLTSPLLGSPTPGGQWLFANGIGGPYQGTGGDNLLQVQSNTSGRGGTLGYTSFLDWQNRVLGYEQAGLNKAWGSTGNSGANWFDPTDELELRTYGYLGGVFKGVPYTPRAGMSSILGATLAAGTMSAPGSRRFYTTYSFDRNLGMPMGQDVSAASNVLFGLVPWNFDTSNPQGLPGSYKCIPVKSPGGINLGAASGDSLGLAIKRAALAANLANLMYSSGYTTDESLSFAVNFLGQGSERSSTTFLGPSGLSISDNGVTATPKLYKALAPAIQPIVALGLQPMGAVPVTVPVTRRYFSYAAQPFLNELAEYVAMPVAAGSPPTLKDLAVELLNPYGGNTSVDMSYWRLMIRVNGVTYEWVHDIGLTVYTAATPPPGANTSGKMKGGTWCVINHATPTVLPLSLSSSPANTVTYPLPLPPAAVTNLIVADAGAPSGYSIAAHTIMLERPYSTTQIPAPGVVPTTWYVVDYIDVPAKPYVLPMFPTVPVPQQDVIYSKQRGNIGAVAPNVGLKPSTGWMFECDSPAYTSGATPPAPPTASPVPPSLGADNPFNGSALQPGVILPDRFATNPAPTDDFQIVRNPQTVGVTVTGGNVGDLADIMRITIMDGGVGPAVGDPAGGDAGNWVTIPDQLASTSQASPTVYPQVSPSWLGQNIQSGKLAGLSSAFPAEARFRFEYVIDPRVRMFFRNLAQVDRASDGTDQIGTGTADLLDENRIAGRVNLNTASLQVLSTLPAFINYVTPTLPASWTIKWQQAVDVIAYRDRLGPTTFTVMAGGTPTPVTSNDFSSTYDFPGRGIKSLPELLVPMAISDGTLLYNKAAHTMTAASGKTLTDVGGTYSTWAKLYGCCTVRSDTFMAYGYIEAVQINRQYLNSALPHNNGSDWYGKVTDDRNTTSTTIPNIRLAKRRFVALLDRSWSNMPRAPMYSASGVYGYGSFASSAGGDVYMCIDPAVASTKTALTDTTKWSYMGRFTLPKILGVRELPQ